MLSFFLLNVFLNHGTGRRIQISFFVGFGYRDPAQAFTKHIDILKDRLIISDQYALTAAVRRILRRDAKIFFRVFQGARANLCHFFFGILIFAFGQFIQRHQRTDRLYVTNARP